MRYICSECKKEYKIKNSSDEEEKHICIYCGAWYSKTLDNKGLNSVI